MTFIIWLMAAIAVGSALMPLLSIADRRPPKSYVINIEQDPEWISPVQRLVDDVFICAKCEDQYLVSPYDHLFREISTMYGNHWCLMSAIGYVESRFNPDVFSRTGAVGLMQIMPRTGKIYDVSVEDLLEPRVNIQIANRHYNYIERMLDIPPDTHMRDRISLVLASYNGGVGHVFDAQRLARQAGEDPHRWLSVARHLSSLRLKDVSEDEVVRFGRFPTARYTIRYVYDVMKRYDEYLEVASASACCLYPYALKHELVKP